VESAVLDMLTEIKILISVDHEQKNTPRDQEMQGQKKRGRPRKTPALSALRCGSQSPEDRALFLR
jgi:hypothetical protein